VQSDPASPHELKAWQCGGVHVLPVATVAAATIGSVKSKSHSRMPLLDKLNACVDDIDSSTRLQPMFPDETWQRLRLFALDPTDVALSKLERNFDRDRDDVLRLARAGFVNAETLKARYYEEVRPYLLSKHEWHDETLNLWLQLSG
jgi:hypothetical protein